MSNFRPVVKPGVRAPHLRVCSHLTPEQAKEALFERHTLWVSGEAYGIKATVQFDYVGHEATEDVEKAFDDAPKVFGEALNSLVLQARDYLARSCKSEKCWKFL